MNSIVWHLVRPFRWSIAGAALCVIISTLIQLAVPALVGHAINAAIRRHDQGLLDRLALAFLTLAVAKPIVTRLQISLTARFAEGFLASLREAAFAHLQQLPLAFFEEERAGALVSRLNADVQAVAQCVRQAMLEIVRSFLQLALTAAIMLALAPRLLAVALVATPILLVSLRSFLRNAPQAYREIRDAVACTLTVLQEGLAGVRVVQAYRCEESERQRFHTSSVEQIAAWRRAARVNARFFPSVALAQAVATTAALGVGGFLYQRQAVSLGALAAFLLYLNGLFEPLASITQWLSQFQAGKAGLERIVALIETPPAVAEVANAVELPSGGALMADDVDFAYSSDLALRGINLAIQPGEHVALVGAAGAGKSTLAKLLARQYDPVAGSVSFGGHDLRGATLKSVRRRIALVPQEGLLFSGSLADNVRLARPEATDPEVAQALEQVGALERFASLPDGLNTDVLTRGARLSAGERQLVALARVALADPEVLILDEATSNLDPDTEQAVQTAVRRLAEGRTVITVTHRLPAARRADRVVVLDQGRVVEHGPHEDLVARGGYYAALWESWRSVRGGLTSPADVFT